MELSMRANPDLVDLDLVDLDLAKGRLKWERSVRVEVQ
jgi:hypothetical protein